MRRQRLPETDAGSDGERGDVAVEEGGGDPYSALADDLASFEFDPLGYVLWAFPWGEPETELEHETGPDDWQRALLTRIGDALRAGGDAGAIVREAVRAGHGVGKSALSAWVIKWALETLDRTRGTVTAMTDTQLRTKTWAELSKWHGMSLTRELFDYQATSLSVADEQHARNWRIDAIPWSSNNPSSFAGLHNKGRRILLLFDEAAEIDDVIWEVAEGALTDANTQIIWMVLGNPVAVLGRFAKCFSSSSGWNTTTVDARQSKFSNKALLKQWADDYGEDSDFYRVRVRGLPPRGGISTFIGPEIVTAARRRELTPRDYQPHPKRLGVDPARYGDDHSVVTLRQGPMVIKQWKFQGLDGPDLAARIQDIWQQHPEIRLIAIDGIGIGASCVDALKRVPILKDILADVNVAMVAAAADTYYDVRAELWGRMREWLKTGVIPDDDMLGEELIAPVYGFDGRARIQLESKKDLKKAERLGRSPDHADSLALTFVADTIASAPRFNVKAQPRNRRPVVWSKGA
jgi:hypothetical protein